MKLYIIRAAYNTLEQDLMDALTEHCHFPTAALAEEYRQHIIEDIEDIEDTWWVAEVLIDEEVAAEAVEPARHKYVVNFCDDECRFWPMEAFPTVEEAHGRVRELRKMFPDDDPDSYFWVPVAINAEPPVEVPPVEPLDWSDTVDPVEVPLHTMPDSEYDMQHFDCLKGTQTMEYGVPAKLAGGRYADPFYDTAKELGRIGDQMKDDYYATPIRVGDTVTADPWVIGSPAKQYGYSQYTEWLVVSAYTDRHAKEGEASRFLTCHPLGKPDDRHMYAEFVWKFKDRDVKEEKG